MEITFKNIDSDYKRLKAEPIGDIQPKFWFRGKTLDDGLILVKRQHSQAVEKNKPRSKMFNHIGEYFGYLIAKKAELRVCPVDLITIHDTKNEYSKTLRFFTGCASHKIARPGNIIRSGEEIIESFRGSQKDSCKKLFSDLKKETTENLDTYFPINLEDNIDLAVLSIMNYTIQYEKNNSNKTKKEIASDVNENLKDFFDMVVYDCLFGNNDRHSGNWSLELDSSEGRARVYPMYDNEAVLALRKPIAELEKIAQLPKSELSNKLDEELFSRMGFGENSSKVSYKEMLDYLIKKYPEYSIPAIKKITFTVSEDFIRSLYDGIKGISTRGENTNELTVDDELPELYREVGMNIFRDRREYVLESLKKVKDKTITSNRRQKENNEELELV